MDVVRSRGSHTNGNKKFCFVCDEFMYGELFKSAKLCLKFLLFASFQAQATTFYAL